jgi:hypothetical protein
VIERVVVRFVEWAVVRWYIYGLPFPVLVVAILLGVFASLGSWWLWPVVAFLAVPTLAVVHPRSKERPAADTAGWHLGSPASDVP